MVTIAAGELDAGLENQAGDVGRAAAVFGDDDDLVVAGLEIGIERHDFDGFPIVVGGGLAAVDEQAIFVVAGDDGDGAGGSRGEA